MAVTPASGTQHALRAGDYEAVIASVGATLRSLTYRGRTLRWSDAHFPKPLTKLSGELERLITKYGSGPG